MDLLEVHALAIKSSYIIKDSDHVYLKETERPRRAWGNHGRTSGGRLLLSARVYKKWIKEFVPPGPECDECGIEFLLNGVCQTYANRELLMADSLKDVRDANKNEVVVLFFGKYGYGLEDLEGKLRESHNRAGGSSSILEQVLSRVRVDNFVDDELHAWVKVLRSVTTIPIDSILEKGGAALRGEARRLHRELVHTRETLFSRERDRKKLHRLVFEAIETHYSRALELLAKHHYISREKIVEYTKQFKAFLSQFHGFLIAQTEHFEATGEVNHNLASELAELVTES